MTASMKPLASLYLYRADFVSFRGIPCRYTNQRSPDIARKQFVIPWHPVARTQEREPKLSTLEQFLQVLKIMPFRPNAGQESNRFIEFALG